jgi:chromosome segregation ATPase
MRAIPQHCALLAAAISALLFQTIPALHGGEPATQEIAALANAKRELEQVKTEIAQQGAALRSGLDAVKEMNQELSNTSQQLSQFDAAESDAGRRRDGLASQGRISEANAVINHYNSTIVPQQNAVADRHNAVLRVKKQWVAALEQRVQRVEYLQKRQTALTTTIRTLELRLGPAYQQAIDADGDELGRVFDGRRR